MISVLIKPASGLCNMRCKYCFYLDEIHARGIMSKDTVNALISKCFEFTKGPFVFSFQGGEPTLAGLEYFQHFVKAVRKKNKNNARVSYTIQTNGLLIDDEFAAFLAEHEFLVGLSVDGTPEIHNKYRKTTSEKPTFKTVEEAAKLLDKHSVSYNVLTVVTGTICSQVHKVYEYYKKKGWRYLQFIPCLDPINKNGIKGPTNAEYYRFLSELFVLWKKDWDNGNYISIRYFDNLVSILAGRQTEQCSLRGFCSNQLVFEADGSCYPCDFYVEEKYLLGNINEVGISDLIASSAAGRFLNDGIRPSLCFECSFFALCGGGCVREWDKQKNFRYCSSTKRFMRSAYDDLLSIAKTIMI